MPEVSCAQNLLYLEHGVEANTMLVFTSCYLMLLMYVATAGAGLV